MTHEQMIEFVGTRIESIKNKEVNPTLLNTNGILLHFIPNNYPSSNPISWINPDHVFKIKYYFRRFTELDTQYSDAGDKIVGYTPNNEYFICFQNGIIETFSSPIEIRNSLDRNLDYVKVDNLFFKISNFMKSCLAVHENIYKSNPPYDIFISLIGIKGAFFASFEKNYVTIQPFPANNSRFQPFVLNNININLMKEIIAGVHYGIREKIEWTKLA